MGDYVYSERQAELLKTSKGYQHATSLNSILDRLLADPNEITTQNMNRINTTLNALLDEILLMEKMSPLVSVDLGKMYFGIESRLRELHMTQKNKFVQAVNNMQQVDKTAFKKVLYSAGIDI